jgi:hypothetical protein
VSTLFDDSGLGVGLERDARFGSPIDDDLRTLGDLIGRIDALRTPDQIVRDPAMDRVRTLASEILRAMDDRGRSGPDPVPVDRDTLIDACRQLEIFRLSFDRLGSAYHDDPEGLRDATEAFITDWQIFHRLAHASSLLFEALEQGLSDEEREDLYFLFEMVPNWRHSSPKPPLALPPLPNHVRESWDEGYWEALRRQYAGLYEDLESILSRHDPDRDFVNLDGYNPEVATIIPKVVNATSRREVEQVLLDEFDGWFGPETEEAFESVAAEVFEAVLRYRSA